eukprot:3165475-Amphidinium_carterae.1
MKIKSKTSSFKAHGSLQKWKSIVQKRSSCYVQTCHEGCAGRGLLRERWRQDHVRAQLNRIATDACAPLSQNR